MPDPAPIQLYLSSNNCTFLNDAIKRNRIGQTLTPIIVPEGYNAILRIIDCQIPNTWGTGQKFLLVRSSLMPMNQVSSQNFLAKIPVNAGNLFWILYTDTSYGKYKIPLANRTIGNFEIGIYNENGSDVNLGAIYDWSITVQFSFEKNI